MNIVKFLATNTLPNPVEVDYWVDLLDNPHGGTIKYFNGKEWVRIQDLSGEIDLSDYYTRFQINALLNLKADKELVDSKLDKSSVDEVVKDISYDVNNPNQLKMIILKYDDTNVAVTVPIVDEYHSGVVTADLYNDLAKKLDIQDLYIEIGKLLVIIERKYLKKLTAGKNILIDENNVISASGDLSVDWDAIVNKPDYDTMFEDIDNDILEITKDTLKITSDLKSTTDRVTVSENDIDNLVLDLEEETDRAKEAELNLQNIKVDKVDGKALSTNDYTNEEKNKLAGIEQQANKYILPAATTLSLGGVKVGDNLSISDDGTITATKLDWENVENKPNFAAVSTSGSYDDLSNKPFIPDSTSDITNDSGYITDYTETDPTVPTHVKSITQSNIDDWNSKPAAINTYTKTQVDTKVNEEKVRAIAAESALDVRITNHNTSVDTSLATKADKSDTYTKSLVDSKVSGLYKVKGSSSFESLPSSASVGDTYNITNDFTLDDKAYSAGTNVVYTENGWDALSGSFNTTAIEEMIQTVDSKVDTETQRALAAEQVNASGIAANTLVLLNKVDKVSGKLLSTEDYTTAEKTKLSGLNDSLYVKLAGNQIITGTKHFDGVIEIGNNTSTSENPFPVLASLPNRIHGTVGGNDWWQIGGSGYTDTGYLEIATGDNGIEPIYVSLNTSSRQRYITLMDSVGKTNLLTLDVLNGIKSPSIELTSGDTNVKGNGTWLKLSNNTTPRIQIGDYNMFPCVDNATDIGGSAFRWRNVYSMNGLFYGKLGMVGGSDMYPHIYGNGSFLLLSGANDNNKSIVIDANNKMYPMPNGTIDCGTSNNRWATLWSNKGNFSNQITSTVATGTAPFIVNSNTMINNLNANFLGGIDINGLTNYSSVPNDADSGSTTVFNLGTSAINNPYSVIEGNQALVFKLVKNSVGNTYDAELAFGFGSDTLAIRRKGNTNTWGAWNKISAGIADVATKLQTQRSIWGQGFDGTNNITGNLLLGVNYLYGYDNKSMLYSNPSGHTIVSACGGNLYLGSGDTSSIAFRTGGVGATERTSITSNGDLRHFGKMIVGANVVPLITLALGDSDTGFNWVSNGDYRFIANGKTIAGVSDTAFLTHRPLHSSVTDGTAPISVASTTVCPNLNALLWNGNHFKYNFNIGTNKYVKILDITVKENWADTPITFDVNIRNYINVRVNICFNNVNNTDPSLFSFTYHGTSKSNAFLDIKLKKVNTSKWEMWYAPGKATYLSGFIYNLLYSSGFTVTPTNIYTDTNPILNGDTVYDISVAEYNAIIKTDVDWYGVSWVEGLTNPDLTRIGNMSLHKSLPILSAMKGYIIYNKNKIGPQSDGVIIPLNDNWTKLKYNIDSETSIAYENSMNNTNTMVKIPEYWYIDDYDESTKTHNLKISENNKAGWFHHKEAYVGAYEAVSVYENSSLCLTSRKGLTPSVNLNLGSFLNSARNNGNINEYKWNTYTYEEHKAICHLFMVEYATRNSLKAVNNTLTSEGYRQGGLGAGCTAGVINNNYSFLSTGSSDILGNGSGEISYTFSGLTRMCNRYRGIENPFGHVWKLCIDIISYRLVTGRSFYKTTDPSKFGTSVTDKHKLITTTNVGSGFVSSMRSTPACDLFPTDIGASTTTCWTDYHLDATTATDGTTYLILFGGDSTYGSNAGLFFSSMDTSVGTSNYAIGNRLTYLP